MYVYTHTHIHIFFIHSSVDGYLTLFPYLVTVNNAAVKMEVHISLQNADFISIGYIPRSRICRSIVALFLTFSGTSIQFSIMAVLIYILNNSTQRFPFLNILNTYHLSCGCQPS